MLLICFPLSMWYLKKVFSISLIDFLRSCPQVEENLLKNNWWFLVGNCGELCNFEANL